jgi:hypothetical protein
MNRIEFEQLSRPEQIRNIREHGVFMADKVVTGDRFYLFAINTFFVEMVHELSNINNSGLVIVRAFDDAEGWDDPHCQTLKRAAITQ